MNGYMNMALGALLGTVFVLFSVSIASEGLYHSENPEKPGFAIEATEEASAEAPADAAPADEALLIAGAGLALLLLNYAPRTIRAGEALTRLGEVSIPNATPARALAGWDKAGAWVSRRAPSIPFFTPRSRLFSRSTMRSPGAKPRLPSLV